MRTLVTGAAGFVGQHLVRRLLAEEHEVVAFDIRRCSIGTQTIQGDIASFNFDKILKDIDVVFHLAGLLGTAELFHKIIEAERVNVLGTLNLLEAMRRKSVNKIVFTSKPNVWKYNAYTITKETCERYLEMYRHVFGFKTIIVRPFNIYGPGEELLEYRKAVPYFVIAALKGEPLEVFGDGGQTMDAIYIDDAVEALIRCAVKAPEETVEIGSSMPIRVKELAKKIIKLADSASPIIYVPMRRGEGDFGIIRANGNIKTLIGFSPKVTLDQGLTKTISWYSKHLKEFNEIYKFKKEDFGKPVSESAS